MSKASKLLESMGVTTEEHGTKTINTTDVNECNDKNGDGLSKGSKVKTPDGEGEVSRIYSEEDKEYVVVGDKSYLASDVEKSAD